MLQSINSSPQSIQVLGTCCNLFVYVCTYRDVYAPFLADGKKSNNTYSYLPVRWLTNPSYPIRTKPKEWSCEDIKKKKIWTSSCRVPPRGSSTRSRPNYRRRHQWVHSPRAKSLVSSPQTAICIGERHFQTKSTSSPSAWKSCLKMWEYAASIHGV